ncbi:hypothetical protein JTE90_026170 [Oedothorax gibbosus]|uniref:Uncharacterized protein n=1 Tax=Oedothorax gibbosus TaxID=931172 RepID=A0AAV6UG41_9ARAC|nr:hypothetical protein JTE90_026170 [Oedothorax gibbosus]
MFFDHDLTYQATSNNRHLGLDDEEFETARLKNMLNESILKVERENWETIKKEGLNPKTVPVSKKNPPKNSSTTSLTSTLKNQGIGASKVSVNKSSISLRKGPISLHAKSSESKTFNGNSSNELPKPVFQDAKTNCPFSNVHFLNQFQASYLAAKPTNRIKNLTEFNNCISSIGASNDPLLSCQQVPEKLCTKSPIHAVQNTNATKRHDNLTVQALPSISINGQQSNAKRNFLVEVIKEKSNSGDNSVKPSVLPSGLQENKIKCQVKQVPPVNQVFSFCRDKSIQVKEQPNISVSTQSFNDPNDILGYKEYIKELVRESLEEFRLNSYQKCNTIPSGQDSALISPNNDCELDSFIGNSRSNLRDQYPIQNRAVTKECISTQTNFGLENKLLDKEQMKGLLKEFLDEYKQTTLVHSETQTDNQHSIQNAQASKEVQVSILPDHSDRRPEVEKSAGSQIEHSDKTTDTSGLVVENQDQINSSSPPAALTTESSTKMEHMISSIYEHFCNSNAKPNAFTPKLSPDIPVTTTDTSTQMKCVITSDKSIETCKIPIPQSNNASTQYEQLPSTSTSVQVSPPTKVDSSDQCTWPCRTAATQTFFTEDQSSVSSTPVSFVDDTLSEGEVYLPWNLRLLSQSDKTPVQGNSNVATEESGCSDVDKVYSLSEGEIPPLHLLQMYSMTSPYDSGSDTPIPPTPFQRNPPSIEISPPGPFSMSEGEVRKVDSRLEGQVASHSYPKQLYESMYSISEGEIRNFNTLSEGEVTTNPHLNLDSQRPEDLNLHGTSSQVPFHVSPYSWGTMSSLSSLDISNEGADRSGLTVPRGLFTVNEEK